MGSDSARHAVQHLGADQDDHPGHAHRDPQDLRSGEPIVGREGMGDEQREDRRGGVQD